MWAVCWLFLCGMEPTDAVRHSLYFTDRGGTLVDRIASHGHVSRDVFPSRARNLTNRGKSGPSAS